MQTARRKAGRLFRRVPSLIIAILVRSETNLERGVYAVLIPLRRYITDRMDDGTLIVHLVLRAGRDLRQPAVLVVDGVAHQLDLGAENVLMERKAGAEPELSAGRSGVEPLPGIGEFDAVEEADRYAPA